MKSNISLNLELSGQDLVSLGTACTSMGLTLNELISLAIADLIFEYKKDNNDLQQPREYQRKYL